ncbi:MAG TPA: hypothetical protein VH372_26735 [Actinospica sp.]|nr:hypothetical protein [Actinospica sp.]
MTGHRPHRLSRRRAGRLLDGDPAARAGEAKLAALIDALEPDEPSDGDAREVPAELLAAFARQAEGAPRAQHGARSRSGARGGPRPLHPRGVLTVKTAAVVLVLSGGTVAAATADALPGPAQRAAYELFGSWGVPAPTPPTGGQPQSPEPPSTGPVLREGSTPAGSAPGAASATEPGPKPSGSASASGSVPTDAGQATTPGTDDCAGHTHGNDHHCEPDDTASPVTNGLATVVGTVATSPPASPTGHTTHTPPGHSKRVADTSGV